MAVETIEVFLNVFMDENEKGVAWKVQDIIGEWVEEWRDSAGGLRREIMRIEIDEKDAMCKIEREQLVKPQLMRSLFRLMMRFITQVVWSSADDERAIQWPNQQDGYRWTKSSESQRCASIWTRDLS